VNPSQCHTASLLNLERKGSERVRNKSPCRLSKETLLRCQYGVTSDSPHWRQYAIKEEAQKFLKYEDLTIEIQCMWNVKAKVILLIIGATGNISKSLRQYLSNTPEKHEIKELQKQPYWALHT